MGKKTLAMILAGGRGERMDILCHLRPKPALPFAGEFRVIDFSLSNCIHSGIDDIAALVDYQRSYMADYLRQWHLKNGATTNLGILEPANGSYDGTADAVYQNLGYVQQNQADMVLVLAGDHVYKLDYRDMLAFHERMKADVTVGVVPVPAGDAYRFGTVTVDGEGRIMGFWEKSRASLSTLASMGIYVFNKDSLIEGLAEDAADRSSRHDFGYSVLPQMVKRARVFAYQFAGYWQDIGTVDSYYETNMELLGGAPPFSLNGVSPVLTARPMPWKNGPASSIARDAVIYNSLISPGCAVRGRVENSILCPGVVIDKLAVVRNSIVMGGCHIGYHSVVDRCILDEGVNIGQMCYVGFGSSPIPGKYDVTLLGKGVTVPPHTAIGRNCRIMPYVGEADFTASAVPHDSVVSTGTAYPGLAGPEPYAPPTSAVLTDSGVDLETA